MNTKVTGSYCIISSLHIANISLLSLFPSIKTNVALFFFALDLLLLSLLIYLFRTPGGLNITDFQNQWGDL